MDIDASQAPIGVLLSGGLDSSILLADLLAQERTIQPIYICTQVAWERHELGAIRRFLQACRHPRLFDLVTLALPLDDLYDAHWSITGQGAPGSHTPDEAVYLPGRNPLLLVKAAVWCQIHGIQVLALATLANNPFSDATEQFFSQLMSLALSAETRVIRPFAGRTKAEVMRLGRGLPLEHTFSCIAPADGLHCGRCNKCAERKAAFESVGITDPTHYLADLRSERKRAYT
jgi:7-cyano-7-deazaguanine synthase